MRPHRLVALAGAAAVAFHAAGKDHVVPLSAPWPTPEMLSPGDRILLEPGLHDPRHIEDWPGTPERPIVVTSADERLPAGLAGIGVTALTGRATGSLVLERLLVVGGGLDLEAGPDAHVTIRDLQILPESRKPGAAGPQVGVRVRGAARCSISAVGVTGWSEVGLWVSDTDRVAIDRPGLVGGVDSLVGIRLDGNRNARVEGGGLVGCRVAAVELGGGPRNRSRIRLDRLVLERPTTAIRLESDVDVEVTRCTIVSPTRAVIEVVSARPRVPDPAAPPPPPATATIEMRRCLTTWPVGGLERLHRIAPDVATTVRLDRNLWWSPELPVALEALGGFPGPGEREVLGLDPRLLKRTWLPQESTASRFGHGAPPDPNPDSGE